MGCLSQNEGVDESWGGVQFALSMPVAIRARS
jgi:hypothetical protein